jgi:hypothetical protein
MRAIQRMVAWNFCTYRSGCTIVTNKQTNKLTDVGVLYYMTSRHRLDRCIIPFWHFILNISSFISLGLNFFCRPILRKTYKVELMRYNSDATVLRCKDGTPVLHRFNGSTPMLRFYAATPLLRWYSSSKVISC